MSDPAAPDHAPPIANPPFEGRITIAPAPPLGMITLRGDLADPAFGAGLRAVTGTDLPAPRQRVDMPTGGGQLMWMSPDEALLVCPRDAVDGILSALTAALAGQHVLLADISDARALFHLSGADIRDVLARLTPADLAAEAMPLGELRRTRLGQVAAGIWFRDATRAELICFRSVAGYVFDLLCNAATAEAASPQG